MEIAMVEVGDREKLTIPLPTRCSHMGILEATQIQHVHTKLTAFSSPKQNCSSSSNITHLSKKYLISLIAQVTDLGVILDSSYWAHPVT